MQQVDRDNEEQSRLRYFHIANLHNTVVERKGLHAKAPYHEIESVDMVRPRRKGDPRALTIRFCIPAGGKGDTVLRVRIKPEDFPAILAFMSATDPQATLKAMAEELRYQICD